MHYNFIESDRFYFCLYHIIWREDLETRCFSVTRCCQRAAGSPVHVIVTNKHNIPRGLLFQIWARQKKIWNHIRRLECGLHNVNHGDSQINLFCLTHNNISLTVAFSQRFFLTTSYNVFITMAFSQRFSLTTSFWQPFLTTFLCS